MLEKHLQKRPVKISRKQRARSDANGEILFEIGYKKCEDTRPQTYIVDSEAVF